MRRSLRDAAVELLDRLLDRVRPEHEFVERLRPPAPADAPAMVTTLRWRAIELRNAAAQHRTAFSLAGGDKAKAWSRLTAAISDMDEAIDDSTAVANLFTEACSARARWGHDAACDVFNVESDLGPSRKPCNCRNRQDALRRLQDPS